VGIGSSYLFRVDDENIIDGKHPFQDNRGNWLTISY
jgi:hypothetical protein